MSVELKDIIVALQKNRVRISDHADEEAKVDRFTFDEIYFSVFHGEVIKDYPGNNPYPSCLIFGRAFSGEPIHSVWAYNKQNGWAVIITVYRPDPELWIDARKRRIL